MGGVQWLWLICLQQTQILDRAWSRIVLSRKTWTSRFQAFHVFPFRAFCLRPKQWGSVGVDLFNPDAAGPKRSNGLAGSAWLWT